MTSKDDKKKAAEIIANAMISRSDSDEKNSHEDALISRMQRAMRDLARPPNPAKRAERKVTRMVPEGSRKTRNSVTSYIKDVYTSAEEARRSFINVSLEQPTREVGPGDRYNDDYHCHGKETNNRN